ncbi:MAG: type II secretion system minor pseudopilin GspH [Steroidobacteraceae bacterium]
MRAPSRAVASGFTLLEVLVVVVIIGIITSVAVISVHVLGGDHEMQQEADRLAALLGQAREDAMLHGRDLGLRVDERGYDFLRYDSRLERWQFVDDDLVLRERTLPDGLVLGLRVESRAVVLKPRGSDTQADPKTGVPRVALRPQVVVQASGDLVPFEIVFTREGTREMRRVVGTDAGEITVESGDAAPR